MRKIVLFCLTLSFFLSLPAILKRVTLGFVPARVERHFPIRSGLAMEAGKEVRAAAAQPFLLIGKGAQSYVFESKDGQYVLKFFTYSPRMSLEKVKELFRACQLVLDRVQEETGVLYIHLDTTELGLPVVECKDGIGRSWRFALDKMQFVLQRRARELGAELKRIAGKAEMEKRLAQFFDCVRTRASRGIYNRDPGIEANFGFLGDRAIEFDFGRYWEMPELDPQEETKRFAKALREWMNKEMPEWAYMVTDVSNSI